MSLGLDDIASGNEREDLRISVLHALNILDTPAEAGFDDIVRLVAEACDTPVALVSFVDVDRQWFKAKIGFDGCETPLDQSVCARVVREKTLIVIPDFEGRPADQGQYPGHGRPAHSLLRRRAADYTGW